MGTPKKTTKKPVPVPVTTKKPTTKKPVTPKKTTKKPVTVPVTTKKPTKKPVKPTPRPTLKWYIILIIIIVAILVIILIALIILCVFSKKGLLYQLYQCLCGGNDDYEQMEDGEKHEMNGEKTKMDPNAPAAYGSAN